MGVGLSEPFPQKWAQQLWTLLFSGPLGGLFYRYARRRGFLAAFSRKNLFNVLPYESSAACVACVHGWLQAINR